MFPPIPRNLRGEDNAGAVSDEVWKERLGLTTGSFIVWGLLLLQLWPTVKRFQLRNALAFLGSDRTPENFAFLYMILLVNLGIWILFLAALHVLARGLWLIGDGSSGDGAENVRTSMKSTAYYSYVGVFVLSGVILAQLLFGALLTVSFFCFKLLNERYVALGKRAFEFLFGFVFTAAVIITFRLFNKRYRISGKFHQLWKYTVAKIPGRYLWGFTLLFACSVVTISYLAATIEIQMNKKIFYLSADRGIEISVELGGSTSSPSAAEINVLDPGGNAIKHFSLVEMELGEGRYAASVPFTGKENPGLYEVQLIYNHPALDFTPPFIHRRTRRTEKFLVVR